MEYPAPSSVDCVNKVINEVLTEANSTFDYYYTSSKVGNNYTTYYINLYSVKKDYHIILGLTKDGYDCFERFFFEDVRVKFRGDIVVMYRISDYVRHLRQKTIDEILADLENNTEQ